MPFEMEEYWMQASWMTGGMVSIMRPRLFFYSCLDSAQAKKLWA